MGERAGNVANVIILPRFNQFDLATGYTFTERFSVSANINNLLDNEGVMTWRGWGVNPGDRQSFEVLPATGAKTPLWKWALWAALVLVIAIFARTGLRSGGAGPSVR